jgi:hypothetical protein
MLVMATVRNLLAVSASATPIAAAAAARIPPVFAPAQEPQPRRARQVAVSQQLAVPPPWPRQLRLMDPRLQLWKEPGPHNWVVRPIRQRCAMCAEKERLRKKLLAQHKDTCIGLFKEIASSQVKDCSKSQSGCGFCDVALCKTSSCFQDWHSQNG